MYKDFLEDAKEAFNGELVEALNEAAVVTDATDVIYNAKISENEPKSKPETAAAYEFDLLGDEAPPEFTLFFDGVPFATAGNITGLTGPEKSGKSTVCSIIAAAAVNPEIEVCGFSSQDLQKLMWIDTEQCGYYAGLQFRRAGGLSGLDLRTFAAKNKFYTLRRASVSQRRAVLFEVLEDGRNSLVIVDGITDVLKSINDESEAVELWAALTEIAERNKLTIIANIHTNKADIARGWAGAELNKKCETIIKVKNEKNLFDFTFALTRGKKPENGTVAINDENGKLYRVNDVAKDPGRPKKQDFEYWENLFANDKDKGFKQGQLKDKMKEVEKDLTDGAAETRISRAKKKGILTQDTATGIYKLGSY